MRVWSHERQWHVWRAGWNPRADGTLLFEDGMIVQAAEVAS